MQTHTAILLLALIVLLVALVAIAQLWPARRLPYQRTRYFLSPAERAFYDALREAIGGDLLIFAKVRLADLLYVPKETRERTAHFNRVAGKHVDFVVCDPHSVSPVLVIELDDSSHEAADRQARDRFVDAVMEAAGLPILHVPVRRSYNGAALADLVRDALGTAAR